MEIQGLLEALRERIQPVEVAAGLIVNILWTLLIIIIGLAVARVLKQRMVRIIARSQATGNLAALLGNAVFIGVIVIVVLMVLGVYGIEGTAVLAVLGAGTVAIGLALQDVLRNMFAGVYLLLEQPFRIGDTIVVDNREGEVESIDVRTTVLRMRDGTQALVPNAMVFATTVMNRTAYPARRISVRISGLEEDLDVITGRALEALRDQPDLVSTPGPKVYVEAINQGKMTVVADIWRRADREMAPGLLSAVRMAFPGADVTLV